MSETHTETEEPLDVFHIHTIIVFGWWDRIKVLFGVRATLRTELPVYRDEIVGGLRGQATATLIVPRLISSRELQGGYSTTTREPARPAAQDPQR